MNDGKIEIENVNVPGRVERVDREKYLAMKNAVSAGGMTPDKSPPVTFDPSPILAFAEPGVASNADELKRWASIEEEY